MSIGIGSGFDHAGIVQSCDCKQEKITDSNAKRTEHEEHTTMGKQVCTQIQIFFLLQ